MLNLKTVLLLTFVTAFSQAEYQPAWLYECTDSAASFGPRCLRNKDVTQGQTGLSLSECQLICGPEDRLLWPKPSSAVLGNSVFAFDPWVQHIRFETDADEDVRRHLRGLIEKRASTLTSVYRDVHKAPHLEISITLESPSYDDLRRNTDESYEISSVDSSFRIKARNYFGARHAIETMFQLMAFDEVGNRFITLNSAEISDSPVFRHRGILFDTVRNFHSVPVLKRLIDGMALSKLNVFHWHLSDSQSFPIALEKYPETTGKMVNYGSYGRKQTYTLLDVAEIVNYAKENGVRVIPEFDMPAHVGYGWQFPGSENFTVCVGKEPWFNYCLEPPCGQLNPFASGMYDILEQLFDEFFDLFKFDSFHMGGDEVNFNCWNTSKEVTDPMIEQGLGLEHDDFVSIWSTFQEKAYSRLRKVSPDSEIILWTSTITLENYIHNLPNENYTIQIWTDSSDLQDGQIKTLANEGFKMIFSNYDALYLDCGIANWVGKGSNWCSPYKGWREVYENNPYKILESNGLELTDELKELVQGAESTMWSEQTDDMMVESMVFPRASALAERLWSNPDNDYLRAETRMVMHRERLVANGVRAASIQPTYCLQNQELCFGDVQQHP